ncbi:MAG: glycosyltransferase [Bacteroidales bacterium]|nr:glycosyltransferase [Bacteroidales bacterium]MCF8344961.1 glycosyltransferase [Bacteroidales bacterium]MCF8350569.1 glycosyltransferase [Bacteroidales bacterium]MCF8377063.1 glycosyltransferase [Bacteroidales bacterium]MCF8400937.1 glycosyltransferase [Bacteroidales bacterium]
MYNDSSDKYTTRFPALDGLDIEHYRPFTHDGLIEEIKQLAAPLEGKELSHVNSTFEGGGVAEMLRSVVPFLRGLGLKSTWYCIEGGEDFFILTKKFHNMIQGVVQEYTAEDLLHVYIENIKNNLDGNPIVSDMTVVHDPQPAASIIHGEFLGKTLWRCHIDTSEADPLIWNFLLPYINHYDGSIFTQKSFVKPGLKIPAYEISPCIDPLNVKNSQYSYETALRVVDPLIKKYGIDIERPMILGVSRYDVHKNQTSIIRAFKELKKKRDIGKLKPMLVLVGNSASDDPEGQLMYEKTLQEIDGDPDIYALLNIPNNDLNIGALMRLANHFVHVSTKEGFGLVVTEAMWQGCPVIGSKVGGIVQQVIDRQTGFLVEPMSVKEITNYMHYFLLNPQERDQMSVNAVEHIRHNFLIPNLIKKYLLLMRFLLNVDKKTPYFRIQ